MRSDKDKIYLKLWSLSIPKNVYFTFCPLESVLYKNNRYFIISLFVDVNIVQPWCTSSLWCFRICKLWTQVSWLALRTVPCEYVMHKFRPSCMHTYISNIWNTQMPTPLTCEDETLTRKQLLPRKFKVTCGMNHSLLIMYEANIIRCTAIAYMSTGI